MFKGTIKELFDKFDSFEWNRGVYVAEEEVSLDTECIVIDDIDEDIIYDGVHDKIILEKEYVDLLRIQDIDQIFFNLKTQISDPSDELKLKAVLYYYETDCFLEVNPEPKVS